MAKILAISHDASLYGAQRSLLDVAAGLARAGHEVEVCVPAPGPLVALLEQRGVPVHVVPFRRWIPSADQAGMRAWMRLLVAFPVALARALRVVRKGRYDLVYTNTVTVLNFAVAAKLAGVPHVWHLRESILDHSQLRSLLPGRQVIAAVRALSARVIYNSRYLQSCYGLPVPENDRVVYNGFTVPSAAPAQPAAADGRVVIVSAGYMDPRKGLDVLLDAFALLPAHMRAETVLQVAGHIEDGYLSREILPRLQRLGTSVQCLGWVDDTQALFARADLVVSSARDEAFGRTLVEAMMVGRPIVATRSGGPEEIVVDGVTGMLVPSNEPQALAEALAHLIAQPQLRAAYGRAGRERAVAEFSLESCVRGIERVMLEALPHPHTPGGPP